MAPDTPTLNLNISAPLGSTLKPLHALAIFLSAFLLFQVEPLIAKIILPWFGGVAAVWTVCLLFFQIMLLLGYLYAHLLTTHFQPRTQGLVHCGLLAASLFTLPILPKDSWKPMGPEHPALHILWVLALAVGLPFFLLSASTSLLQAWFTKNTKGEGVFRFYALSNAASLLALLSYPTFFEPRLSTLWQARSWSVAFAAAAALCGAIAFMQRGNTARDERISDASRPTWRTRFLWIALTACSSALLLAITNHVSQNIAAVPLLWIIPLSLYLLSFILCFERSVWYPRTFFLRLLAVAVGGTAYALSPSYAALPFWLLTLLFCAALFVCCMLCHGELARLKPYPSHLTSFYFLSSLGSVIGAVFVALLAPQIFSGFYELHVALAVCVLLVIVIHRGDPASPFRQGGSQLPWIVLNALAAAVIVSLFIAARAQPANTRLMVRNFYGVLRVSDEVAPNVVVLKDGGEPSGQDSRFRRLLNGTISHGLQFLAPERRDQPTSYYGRKSGIGIALQGLGSRGTLRVGVIGLGAGTIAAYGRAGDDYECYEINPLVLRIAQQEFSFLRDSKARVTFELGDARLTLERQSPQQFDALAVDAFSSDSIPVHLLTIEAFELYFRHLRRDGILAVHISNRYLNLDSVVAAAARKLGKDAVLIDSPGDNANGTFVARWVLLANRDVLPGFPDIEKVRRPLTATGGEKLWTDSYSSLFSVLK
jgi:SAM-dependent methyltransferase